MMDQWPRLAYLALLLVALGGYLIVELRRGPGRAIRQMLAWGLIFLGLAAGFGLWQELRPSIFPTQVVSGDRIELPLASDGHFHITLRLNGQEVPFLIDTGASEIALRQRDARRIGIDPEGLRYTGTANTANGIVSTAPVTIELIEIGDISDRNVPASVVDADLGVSLLGMTYLRRFARVSFEGSSMILER
ncbi:MAG: TIGR02281 family clan AA aspartic protease [Paracoccus sp. (in: a-proteobacteria)]|nr:TIGR02281 family clan AA aspartic protease [Paracoccus sp. (in: a-proteobacteria)]